MCRPTKIEKGISSPSVHFPHSASCPLLLSPSPLLFRPLTPLVHSPPSSCKQHQFNQFTQFQSSAARLLPVPARLEAGWSKEERTGSIHALHCRRGLDIIYFYLHLLLLRYRKRMKSRDGANRNVSREPSHIETSYSRVSW